MVILDKMILSRRLTEFVCEILKIRDEELIDKARWEAWLHKIHDMEFSEYLSKLDNGAQTEEVPRDEILESTVKESWGIINDFCPF
jgi:hypothetical protein